MHVNMKSSNSDFQKKMHVMKNNLIFSKIIKIIYFFCSCVTSYFD